VQISILSNLESFKKALSTNQESISDLFIDSVPPFQKELKHVFLKNHKLFDSKWSEVFEIISDIFRPLLQVKKYIVEIGEALKDLFSHYENMLSHETNNESIETSLYKILKDPKLYPNPATLAESFRNIISIHEQHNKKIDPDWKNIFVKFSEVFAKGNDVEGMKALFSYCINKLNKSNIQQEIENTANILDVILNKNELLSCSIKLQNLFLPIMMDLENHGDVLQRKFLLFLLRKILSLKIEILRIMFLRY
jgi:hypothetical protein